MPPLTALSLTLNTLALTLTLGTLLLALRQRVAGNAFRVQKAFLGCTAFWIAVTALGQSAATQGGTPDALAALVNLSTAAYGLATVIAFTLIVTVAEKTQGPLDVMVRTGVTFWLLFQLPLWQGELIATDAPGLLGIALRPVGLAAVYASTILFIYQGLSVWLAHRYRERIRQPGLILAVVIFQVGNACMTVVPALRELGIGTWLAGPVAALLGYNLIRQTTIAPLLAQVRRIRILRDLALALASPSSGDLAGKIARYARQLTDSDTALLFLLNTSAELEVAACVGENVPIGTRLGRGQGLAGWVVQSGQPLRVGDHVVWDSGLEGFHRLDFCAAMSVPLIHDGHVLGAITVGDQDVTRRFSDEDQALLEVLALQAAVALSIDGLPADRT